MLVQWLCNASAMPNSMLKHIGKFLLSTRDQWIAQCTWFQKSSSSLPPSHLHTRTWSGELAARAQKIANWWVFNRLLNQESPKYYAVYLFWKHQMTNSTIQTDYIKLSNTLWARGSRRHTERSSILSIKASCWRELSLTRWDCSAITDEVIAKENKFEFPARNMLDILR